MQPKRNLTHTVKNSKEVREILADVELSSVRVLHGISPSLDTTRIHGSGSQGD